MPTNPPLEESSLDRYLESRAGLMLSHANLRRGLVIMGAVGIGMLLVTLAFGIVALVSGQPQIMAGAIGPGIAGLVNVTLSRVLRRKSSPALEVNANLTPEARAFMANLMKDVYGWPRAWGAVEPSSIWNADRGYMNRFDRRRERHIWRRMLTSGSWGQRQHSAKECLTSPAFDVLDRAAFQYNRVAGILGAGHPEVARFESTIKSAADQAMADVFHVAHLLDAYPESQSTAQAKGEQEIAALKELADWLEALQTAPATAVAESPSPISAVLDELRLDQLARVELGKAEQEEHIDLNA